MVKCRSLIQAAAGLGRTRMEADWPAASCQVPPFRSSSRANRERICPYVIRICSGFWAPRSVYSAIVSIRSNARRCAAVGLASVLLHPKSRLISALAPIAPRPNMEQARDQENPGNPVPGLHDSSHG